MKLLRLKPVNDGEYRIPACIAVQHIVSINVSPNGPNGKWLIVITTTDGSFHTVEYDTFEEANRAYSQMYIQVTEDK